MKKMRWLIPIILLFFAGTLVFSSFAAEATPHETYFSVERKLLEYSVSVENKAFSATLEVTTGRQSYHVRNWQETFAEEPRANWIYILPHGEGAKYQPLVSSNGQGFDTVLDTLYYVNADGWIAALDVATRTEKALFKPEGKVKRLQATVDLIFYECAGQLYRYYIPSGKSDFFMTLPYNRGQGWSVVSNQTVKFSMNYEGFWYNREEDQYYENSPGPDFFYVKEGEENQIPTEISPERTPASKESLFELKYEHLIRLIPETSILTGKITYGNMGTGEFLFDDSDVLRQEMHYLGLIDMGDDIWDIEKSSESARLSAATLKQVYERVFGPGTFASLAGKDIQDVTGGYFIYDKETDEYVYYCYSYGGGDPAMTGRRFYFKAEEKNGTVNLYFRDASISQGGTVFYAGNTSLTHEDYGGAFAVGFRDGFEDSSLQPDTMLVNGAFDEYLPVYVASFRQNADGSYRWVSTEMVEEGKEIPKSCFGEWSLPTGKMADDEYFSFERQLVTSPFASLKKTWTTTVFLTEENLAEWKPVIFADEPDRDPPLGLWVYRKFNGNGMHWSYSPGGDILGTFGYYCYRVKNGVLYEWNLDASTATPLFLSDENMADFVAFRDLLFYRVGNKVYRYYIPDGTLDEVATLPDGATWEPASNRVLCITVGGETYWYDTESDQRKDSYDGPEIISVAVEKLAKLDAGELIVTPPASGSEEGNHHTTVDGSGKDETNKTADASDSAPRDGGEIAEETSGLWVWIGVGIGIGLAVAIAVTVLLRKKKK